MWSIWVSMLYLSSTPPPRLWPPPPAPEPRCALSAVLMTAERAAAPLGGSGACRRDVPHSRSIWVPVGTVGIVKRTVFAQPAGHGGRRDRDERGRWQQRRSTRRARGRHRQRGQDGH